MRSSLQVQILVRSGFEKCYYSSKNKVICMEMWIEDHKKK